MLRRFAIGGPDEAGGAPPSFLDRFGPLVALAAGVAMFGAAMFSTPGGFVGPDSYRNHDFLIAATHDAIARDTILNHHRLPGHSHLVGGGYPVSAHPSSGAYSPLFIPSLLFGERIGLRIAMIVSLFVGGWGVFLLARDRYELTDRAATVAALSFVLAGWYPSRILVGFYETTVWLLFPMALYLAIETRRRLSRFFAAAVIMMTAFMQGLSGGALFMIWATAHAAAGIGTRLVEQRWKTALRLIVVAAVACLLGAVKFVPMTELFYEGNLNRLGRKLAAMMPDDPEEQFLFRRSSTFYHTRLDANNPSVFLPPSPRALEFLTAQTELHGRYELTPDGAMLAIEPEYAHVGLAWAAVVLAIVGAALGGRAGRRVAVSLLVILWISLGSNAPIDLFRPLHMLPVINRISRPMQYLGFFLVFEFALAAGIGFAAIERHLPERRYARASWFVLIVLALLPNALLGAQRIAQRFSLPLEWPEHEPTYYQVALARPQLKEQLSVGWGSTYLNVLRGVGSIVWDDAIVLPRDAQPKYYVDDYGGIAPAPEYRGEAWFDAPGNEVLDQDIGPDRIVIALEMTQPGTLIVNQNHDRRWQSSAGRVWDSAGLLAVDIKRPVSHIELRYRYSARDVGLTISLATLATFAAGPWIRRRWTRRRAARGAL
ncbi:hypothetical protein K8I61_12355 [bacterium]|nr:hypothetical protein [bacterium]